MRSHRVRAVFLQQLSHAPPHTCGLVSSRSRVELRRRFFPQHKALCPGCRPELLLDGEFQRLPAALEKLEAAFPDSDVGGMVAAQPLLLVEDIEVVIEELRRRATHSRCGVQQTCGWGP